VLAGAVFFVLSIIFAALTSGAPSITASGQDTFNYISAHHGRLQLAAVVMGLAMPAALVFASGARLLPEVPTIHEAGAPGYDVPIWYGLRAPAGTPAAIIEKLSADISTSITAPDLTRRLGREDAQPISMTQQRFARFVLDETNAPR
jgi:tripartite-type tricarboxylate transporter receptor subunit TctC